MDMISLMRFRKVRVVGMYHLVLMGTHCRMMFPLSSVTGRLMANTVEFLVVFRLNVYHLTLFGGEGEGFKFQFHGCR